MGKLIQLFGTARMFVENCLHPDCTEQKRIRKRFGEIRKPELRLGDFGRRGFASERMHSDHQQCQEIGFRILGMRRHGRPEVGRKVCVPPDLRGRRWSTVKASPRSRLNQVAILSILLC